MKIGIVVWNIMQFNVLQIKERDQYNNYQNKINGFIMAIFGIYAYKLTPDRAGSHSRTAVNWNNPKFPNWKQKSFSRTQDLGNKIVIFCHN